MKSKPGRDYGCCSYRWSGRVGLVGWIVLSTLMVLATGLAVHAGDPWGWSSSQTRLLFDACFADIEVDATGKRIRHCPHHEMNGDLSAEQLIFVLGTIHDEAFVDPRNRAIARKHLENHYQKIHAKLMQADLTAPLNINRVGLLELVTLPRIGPVLAVKVVQYRNSHAGFGSVEDLMKVEGIGRATFRAIRPYVCID